MMNCWLVGLINEQPIPLLNKRAAQFHRHVDGVPGDFEVKVVGKERIKLDAEQPALASIPPCCFISV